MAQPTPWEWFYRAVALVVPIALFVGGCWVQAQVEQRGEDRRQVQQLQGRDYDKERRLSILEARDARHAQDMIDLAQRLERIADRLERRAR